MPEGIPRPKVSICVPAYQAERHLRSTIESLLAQNYLDFEIVIVDNHSTDGTADILKTFDDPRIRVIRNEATLSMVDNFNLAVSQCQGDLRQTDLRRRHRRPGVRRRPGRGTRQ